MAVGPESFRKLPLLPRLVKEDKLERCEVPIFTIGAHALIETKEESVTGDCARDQLGVVERLTVVFVDIFHLDSTDYGFSLA